MPNYNDYLALGSLAGVGWLIYQNQNQSDGSDSGSGDDSSSEVKILTIESVSDQVCIYQLSADTVQSVASTETVSRSGKRQDAVGPNSPVDVYSYTGTLQIKADYPERALFEVTDKGGTREITPDALQSGEVIQL